MRKAKQGKTLKLYQLTTWLIQLFTFYTIGLVIHCRCSYCSANSYSRVYFMAKGSIYFRARDNICYRQYM